MGIYYIFLNIIIVVLLPLITEVEPNRLTDFYSNPKQTSKSSFWLIQSILLLIVSFNTK